MPHEDAPTMIIPQGTEIEVDVHGQMSIRTPGNLVIQSSGHFATLESRTGSIRIEPEARVEAVTVRCAETCFIQGRLTAWKVSARAIHLEETAKANIVLQEAEHLEVGSRARLVGNFGSENELFLLFSRFADQLRSLPLFAERPGPKELSPEMGDARLLGEPGAGAPAAGASAGVAGAQPPSAAGQRAPGDGRPAAGGATGDSAGAGGAAGAMELPDPLFFSLVILEREFGRPSYGPSSQRVLEELIKLLRLKDFDTLKATYRTLFGRVVEPGKDVQRVYELIGDYFRRAS